MNTFAKALQNRLDNLPLAKEFLASASTQRLRTRSTHFLGLPYLISCGMCLLVPFVLVGYKISSPPVWLGWAAVVAILVVWGLQFGKWVPNAVEEWNQKAKALGLGWVDLHTQTENATDAEKVETIERCAQSGATAAQIKHLYTTAKDSDLPRKWWWSLNHDAGNILTNELRAQNEQNEQREQNKLAAQQEILARLKIYANSGT